jgi:formate hydrogenlyase transcriptional activator
VPPLRERRGDVPLLVTFFLTGLSKKLGKRLEAVSGRSMEWLAGYHWPGNVRELQNVIERAAILASGPVIELDGESPVGAPPPVTAGDPATLEGVERAHIVQTLESTSWVVEGTRGAATILGLHPNTLRSRMKKLGIARPRGGPRGVPSHEIS